MRRIRRPALVVILAFLLIGLLAKTETAQAQSFPSTHYDWCEILDFTHTDYGATYEDPFGAGFSGQYQFPGYGIENADNGAVLFDFSNNVSVAPGAVTFNFVPVHGIHDNIDIVMHAQPFGLQDGFGLDGTEVNRDISIGSLQESGSVTVNPSGSGQSAKLFQMYFAANDDVYLQNAVVEGNGVDPFSAGSVNGESAVPCSYATASPTPTFTPSRTPTITPTPSPTLSATPTLTPSPTSTAHPITITCDLTTTDAGGMIPVGHTGVYVGGEGWQSDTSGAPHELDVIIPLNVTMNVSSIGIAYGNPDGWTTEYKVALDTSLAGAGSVQVYDSATNAPSVIDGTSVSSGNGAGKSYIELLAASSYPGTDFHAAFSSFSVTGIVTSGTPLGCSVTATPSLTPTHTLTPSPTITLFPTSTPGPLTNTPVVISTPTRTNTPAPTFTLPPLGTLPPTRTQIPAPTQYATATLSPTITATPSGGPELGGNGGQCDGLLGLVCLINSLGDFFNWLINTLLNFFAWLLSLFRWLAGTLSNLFTLLGNLLSGLGGLLNLIGALLNALLLILHYLLAIAGHLLSILGDLISEYLRRFGILLSAYADAAPIPIPFLPQCVSDPMGSQLCAVWDILENTIFAGTLGVLIIPLLNGILGLTIALFVLLRIRSFLKESSEVTDS